MKKLKRTKMIALIWLALVILFELMGTLGQRSYRTIIALALLVCLVVFYLIFYRCPYCKFFLGGRERDNYDFRNGRHQCPRCKHELEEQNTKRK